MARHPGCVSYEVFEGVDGQVADRIVWVDQPAALRANREFAATAIAAGMQDIIASYQNFFGAPVLLR
jgi:hypothetical protein